MQEVHYLTIRYAYHAPLWQFVVWSRQILLFFLAISLELFSLYSPTWRSLIYWHAAGAMVTLLFFLFLHLWKQPFCFAFQNYMESALYVCNMILLGLACVYTFVTQLEEIHLPDRYALLSRSPLLHWLSIPLRDAERPCRNLTPRAFALCANPPPLPPSGKVWRLASSSF